MKGDGEKVDQQAFIFVKICGPKFFDVPVVSIPTLGHHGLMEPVL
jgi:hypothetical protein